MTHRSASPAILLMAHGTQDTEGQRELLDLERLVRCTTDRRAVALGVLEYPNARIPSIQDAAESLTRQRDTIIAVPVLLLRAGHAKFDMPTEFGRARARFPCHVWKLARPLMPHALLRRVAYERIVEAVLGSEACDPPFSPVFGINGDDTSEMHDPKRPALPPSMSIVLVGRGSHDAGANADMIKIARLFAEEYASPRVEACFISQTEPGVPEAIRRCVALGARSIVVAPYFLHTGVLVRRIRAQVDEVARSLDCDICVTRHLGNHPHVVRLLILRTREADFVARASECFAGISSPPGFIPCSATAPGGGHHAPHEHAAHIRD